MKTKMEKLLFKISQVEKKFNYAKLASIDKLDGEADFEIRAPHYISEKFDLIIQGKKTLLSISPTRIKIKISVVDFNKEIDESIVKNFLNYCKEDSSNNVENWIINKNERAVEYWLIGGLELTEEAKKMLNDSPFVYNYYSQEDINKIELYYQSILNNLPAEDNSVDISEIKSLVKIEKVYLVKFSKFKNGRLYKEHNHILNEVTLTEKIVEFLKEKEYLNNIDIYDEENNEIFQRESILKKDLVKILDFFMREIEDKISFILSKISLDKEKNIAINELTVLLNFRKILLSKLEKYRDDETIALIMG